MNNIKLKLKYDKDLLQDYYMKLYYLKNLEKNYFNYIDFDHIYSFSESEINHIKNLTKTINIIIKKAYSFYHKDFKKNLSEFYDYKDSFEESYDKIEHLIERYDLLLSTDWNYKFIEINANTPWLINDIYHISSLNKPNWYKNINANFEKHIQKYFKKHKWKKIWILLPYSYEDEDFLTCVDYKNIIEKVTKDKIIIWDIYETNIIWNDFFTIKWEKVDILLNFFPIDFFLTDKDYLDSFLKIIKKNNLIIQNPLESILLQDKLIFAVIWENIETYSLLEKEFIQKHIPFTTRVFQEESEKYIAKDRFWRIWRWVYENNFFSNIDNKEKFIYQEKIKSQFVDEQNSFAVLWVFTNMDKIISLIWRKQTEFISQDWNNKIVMCYEG